MDSWGHVKSCITAEQKRFIILLIGDIVGVQTGAADEGI